MATRFTERPSATHLARASLISARVSSRRGGRWRDEPLDESCATASKLSRRGIAHHDGARRLLPTTANPRAANTVRNHNADADPRAVSHPAVVSAHEFIAATDRVRNAEHVGDSAERCA